MANYVINDNRIELTELPKKFKKCTATRFASILGLNAWSTPFSAWCEITRTYEEPFEDSIYTIAGKVIEPKIINYLNKTMFMDIKSPTDVYGPDYFKKTWGDFFPDQKELGGMWDALGDDFVVEIKTTKRAEDWALDVPIYYKLQACLYAYLLGFDNVVMTASFLEDKDYANPELFEPSYKNTKIYEFKVSEAFPTFEETYVKPALNFWRDHVETGISPEYDEKRDAEILKVLRKNTIEPKDSDIAKLMKEGDKLQAQIEKHNAKIEEKEKRLKEINDLVKASMIKQFRDGDKHVEIKGASYTWDVRRDISVGFDSAKFKKENEDLYKKYETKTTTKYVLTKKLIEEV